MVPLGFSSAVSGADFTAVSIFDDYFSFSGRKYSVIKTCVVDGVNGWLVKENYVKPNIPLNILKIISILFIVVPLIMGIGKLLARSRHHFFVQKKLEQDNLEIELTSSTSNQSSNRVSAVPTREPEKATDESLVSSLENSPTGTTGRVLPQEEQKFNERNDEIQEFKKKALLTFSRQNPDTYPLDFSLSPEQENCLLQAHENKFYKNLMPEGVKMIRGGSNFVFFLDAVPEFVFKPVDCGFVLNDSVENVANAYIETADKARRIVSDNNLHLLHVPQSEVIKIGDQYFIMQEKADLISGDYRWQKGVYLHCWNDEELRDYMKTLFTQLVTFISKTGFSDVKYDNIPITREGKVALIDLDELSTFTGLTREYGGGLLNYIPVEYLDEFIQIAEEQLTEEVYTKIKVKIEEIRERANTRKRKNKKYSKFLQSNSIVTPSQMINPNLPMLYEDDEKKQKFAEKIIKHLNELLSEKNNFSIREGRKIILPINNNNYLYNAATKIWTEGIFYSKFKTTLSEVLEDLKKAEYINNYKVSQYYPWVKVIC